MYSFTHLRGEMLNRITIALGVICILSGCSSTKVQQPRAGTEISLTGDIRLLAQLPDAVIETSGIAQRDGLIWTLNDSGDGPVLYALNTDFKLQRRVNVSGAKNVDWEELAQDEEFLYVADCGNNRASRIQLQIYKIRWSELLAAETEVASETITFEYADRTDFSSSKNHNYDCEALASVGNELWLFSKNRKDEKTNLYRLDKNRALQHVYPTDSFDVRGLITAADYDLNSKSLVLLGYEKNIIFGSSFVWVIPTKGVGEIKPIWEGARFQKLSPYAQWEAILWDRDPARGKLILTTEKSPLLDVSIGELDVFISKP